MKFIKYPSIENSCRGEFINKIITEGYYNGDWYVTEKVHGSNLSIWVKGKEIRVAKRTCFIDNDDNFYGFQKLKEGLFLKAREMYNLLGRETVAIFGEIFGGIYPHPVVTRNPQAKKVQKGVYYSPNNEFFVYDIKVDGRFVDFLDMQAVCRHCDILYAKTIFKGSFMECLNYKNDFPSTIYKEFGLPEFKDNICEGIVIRPNEARFLYNHSRIMLKSKNDKFKEKMEKPKIKKDKVEFSDVMKEISDEQISMITEARYNNIVSHIGGVARGDFGKLQGLLMKDINEEFVKNIKLDVAYHSLEKREQKTIKKTASKAVANLIRKQLIGSEK